MPIYFYFGEDDFALGKAVETLRTSVLDPTWASFNYDRITPDQADSVITGLNQAMTPPFGAGSRFVWLIDTNITQQCSPDLQTELERTLPLVPTETVLLFTTTHNPDGRLKSTKLLKKYAECQEFASIPPWKTELIEQRVKEMASELKVRLTPQGVQLLAELVGNDSRLLFAELTKLKLYGGEQGQVLDHNIISSLVNSNTQSSLKLAEAIKGGDTDRALLLLGDLIRHNEAPLRIVATLVGQFRTWLWVKLLVEMGEKDEQAIAQAADISNPKRIYFIKKEVNALSLKRLEASLPLLLELEASLKRGGEEVSVMQTKIIQLCDLFKFIKYR